jgi:drug/metabolite transporter (DMT)-like permease
MTDTPSTQPAERRLFALGLRAAAIFVFSAMVVCVKLAGESGVHLTEIMFWRHAFALPVVLFWVIMNGGLPSLKTNRILIHGRRAVFGTIGMVLNLGAVILLPLAEATTIGFAVPLFATVLAALILKETVGWQRWSAVLVGFVGILLVVRPGANALPLFGSLVALGAAMTLAVISLQIRDLARTETAPTIAFWFAALSVLPLATLLPFFATPHDWTEWALLIGIGVSGGIGQILLTASYRFAPVSVVVSMDYVGLIWATLWGWLIWDHLPPSSTWTGVPFIIGAALFIAWREHKLSVERTREIAA